MIKGIIKKTKKLWKLFLFLKFPAVYLSSNMKDRILQKAGEMFLNLGFKSVTMDDISSELGISKKTVYKYFSNKSKLVEESASKLQDTASNAIDLIKEANYNAIEEEFAIKAVFKEMLKNAKDSPIFQLNKYYPEIAEAVKAKEICIFKDCNSDNLKKGIAQGFYRDDIDINEIMQFYFALIFGVFESNLFATDVKKLMETEYKVLEYHIRAIATEKGVKELEKQLEIINQKE